MTKTIFTHPLRFGDSVEVSCCSLEYELLNVTQPDLLQDVIRDFVLYFCRTANLIEIHLLKTVSE